MLPARFDSGVAGAVALGVLGFVLVLVIEYAAKRLEARGRTGTADAEETV